MLAKALPRKAIPFIPLQRSEQGVKQGCSEEIRKGLHFLPRHAPPTPPPIKVPRAVSSPPGPQG